MRLQLISVVRRRPAWLKAGFDEYARRLPEYLVLSLTEIPPQQSTTVSAEIGRRREAQRILAAVPITGRLIALDERGHQHSSTELSVLLQAWLQDGRDLALAVGGADGLDNSVLARAEFVWSLSRLTFPHAFVPVLVAEQLYRASSLLARHPYHRG